MFTGMDEIIISEARRVYDFWFREHGPGDWFAGHAAFDGKVREHFSALHKQASAGELSAAWRETPREALCEIIILDQFSRQIYRNTPHAFAYDLAALILSQNAIAHNFDRDMSGVEKQFLYMPFMHSESIEIQEQSIELYEDPDLKHAYDYAVAHYKVIAEFGRFPHRNKILGRSSDPAEEAYLSRPGAGF